MLKELGEVVPCDSSVLFKLSLRARRYLGSFCRVLLFFVVVGR